MFLRIHHTIMGALVSLTLVANASAQPAEQVSPLTAAETATPAMWRVADEDSEFFLLGTFHILPPSLQWRTEELEKAFEAAETVYFEVDATAPGAQSKTINIMMTKGFNPVGVTLTSMLDEQDAAKLKSITQELSLPFAGIDPMRPWQAFLTLSVKFIINQGFDPGAGVDSVLVAEARTIGKDVKFFETIEEQLTLFTGLDPETEKTLLITTIRDWDNQSAVFDDLYNAWRVGDTNYIDVQMNNVMREEAPKVYDRLIVDRNKAWAEDLTTAIRDGEGAAFVAVGAAHLVGEHSVPALLEAEGFEVSRYGVETETPEATDETLVAANDNEAPEETATDDIETLLEAIE